MRTCFPLLLSIALSGCAIESLNPQITNEGLPDGFDVSLTVEPEEVIRHAPFVVRITATNTTTDTIDIVTANSCLVRIGVFRGGMRVPMQGSDGGCRTAITTHSFAPGVTWEMDWPMRAELYAQHAGETNGAPVPIGSYRIRAEFDLLSNLRPAVEATLQVR